MADHVSGSINPVSKRQRTTITPYSSPPPLDPHFGQPLSVFRAFSFRQGEEEREEVDEGEEEQEEEEEEEEQEEEEEEEEEEEVEEEETERVETGTRDEVGSETVRMNVERSQSFSTEKDAISVILSDPDVLNCPICIEPLTIPVFQCENGHIACNCCCPKLNNKCPSCSKPIGCNRCRAIEKVIESIKISCENMKYGCKETFSYRQKLDHGLLCLHAPCSCPSDKCSFVGSFLNLYQHFSSNHSCFAVRFFFNKVFSVTLFRSRRHVILEEKNDGVIFVINFSREDHGTLVNIDCIGPSTSKRRYSYEVKAKKGESSVVLQSVTENVPFWTEHSPEKAFLLVPKHLEDLGSFLKVEVCIRPS